MLNKNIKPVVGVIMGSDSDMPVMKQAIDILDEFNIPYEVKITSAHRTPDLMSTYSKTAYKRGIKVIIAGAGGSAHLPGMCAAYATIPVIGVPIETKALKGLDSLSVYCTNAIWSSGRNCRN
jgi:5-(carboxyamino)imidazole ribonucleotide mutase